MKKVLKLSSLLAAVMLLAALGAVQLMSAQTVRTSIDADMDYVSSDSDDADATNSFVVTVTDSDSDGLRTLDTTEFRYATVTVENITREASADYKGKPGNKLSLTAGGTLAAADATVSIAFSSVSTTVTVFQSTSTTGFTEGDHIVAEHGDRIRVRYVPKSGRTRTDEVVVDAKGPVITSQSPAHNTRTKAEAVTFVAEFKDDGVGLGKMADVDANTMLVLEDESEDFRVTDLKEGNWRIRAVILLGEDGDVSWQVTVKDTLGNETKSIAVKADPDAEIDEVEKHKLTLDTAAPTIETATTGDTLDTSGAKAEIKTGAGNRKSIAVMFDEDLDGATVQETDFRVEVEGQQQSIASVTWNPDVKDHVFITLENDISGDGTPTVRVVGPIEDVAGNAQATTQKVAVDGIAPMLTVSVTGSAGTVTNDTLTILVSADEKSRNPSRTNGITVSAITKGTDDNEDKDIVGDEASFSASKFRTVTSNEQWEWTFSLANATDGKYNVCIQVSDISGSSGNQGSKGTCPVADTEVLIDDDKSITFTIDTAVADPTVTPEKTDNAGTFIEITYGEKITAVTATVAGDKFDTSTLDDKTFTIAPPADGFPIGKHEVAVTATDVAGNTKTAKKTVEITARAAFKVNLRPGYNLISFPGTPESTAINDIIGADHSINQVLTYSPFIEGGWLSAERGDDGAFAGTLMELDGGTAYIVRTTSFEPLNVMIPRAAAGDALPPQTNLGVGWNLVPVIDLSSDKASGDTVEDYFQGVGDAILTLDTSGRLVANDGDDGVVGKGYWVYASRPAVLLPTRR